jgi:hypothetical protein
MRAGPKPNRQSQEWVGRSLAAFCRRRKVRAGQGTVVANGHRGRLQGKCHRKDTADGSSSGAQAKVKWCSPSPFGLRRILRSLPTGERSRTVRAHRGGGDVAGRVNPTACKTKQPTGYCHNPARGRTTEKLFGRQVGR